MKFSQVRPHFGKETRNTEGSIRRYRRAALSQRILVRARDVRDATPTTLEQFLRADARPTGFARESARHHRRATISGVCWAMEATDGRAGAAPGVREGA